MMNGAHILNEMLLQKYYIYKCLSNGCNYRSILKNVEEHELSCVLKIFNCPVKSCDFTAAQSQMEQHCINSHTSMVHSLDDQIVIPKLVLIKM